MGPQLFRGSYQMILDVQTMFSRCFQDVCRIFPGCFQDTLIGLIGLVEFDDRFK